MPRNKCYFFVVLFFVTVVALTPLLLSKALSANIDIDTSALKDPDFTYVENDTQEHTGDYSWDNPNPDGSDYLIIEDAMGNRIKGKGGRRPTDELPDALPVITDKMVKDIETMEVRHFKKKMRDASNEDRLSRLEKKLTGRSWEDLPLKDRMRRIRLASQRVALRGTSIPANLRRIYTPNRIENDSIPLVENENDVGILDGLLRLYNPDLYKVYSTRRERLRGYDK